MAGVPHMEGSFQRSRALAPLEYFLTLTARTLQTTKQYQEFKTAGTEGITGCEIRSIILPLLADHVIREANHYLRILEYAQKGRD